MLFFVSFILMLGCTISSWSDSLQASQPLSCQDSFDLAVQALKKDRFPLLPDKKLCPIEHKTVSWVHYTRHPDDFESISTFIKENPFWPDQEKIREMAEQSIKDSTPDKIVIDYFKDYPPLTSHGALVYAQRLCRISKKKSALLTIENLWTHTDFKPKDEKSFYNQFKSYLSADSHHKRLDRLILDGNYYGLKQMKEYISKKGQEVVDYAIALIQKKSSFRLKWTGIPTCYKLYPGLSFQYLKWLLNKKQDEEGLRVFETAVACGAFKQHPDLLVRYRSYFARYFLHAQDWENAYAISEKYPVDPKSLKSKVDYTESEWLAAWLELRKHRKPESARTRFEALHSLVSTPISRSKMAYWCGRAHQALGHREEATSWYQKASEFPHTYYGQLALKRLKKPIKITLSKNPKHVILTEQESDLVQATNLLSLYGFTQEKEKILLYLAKNGQKDLGEFLVNLCHEVNMPHLAVIVAKFMSQKAPVLTEKAYPIVTLTSEALSHPSIDEVLIHSVIRQESNFNTRSISTADARGFMQLIYTTASRMAKKLKISLKKEELTQNPHKNIRIGSAYLSGLLDQFQSNYILALASYNAGPDKAETWIKIYGHPSSKEEDDLIDWIESIPYGETRGYVQRITETLPIYAERLNKKSLYP